MKKIFTVLILALVITAPALVGTLASPVLASDIFDPLCKNNTTSQIQKVQNTKNKQTAICGEVKKQDTSKNPIISLIKSIINIIILVIVTAAVITIIISGLRIVTSGGDSESVAGARTSILVALAGMVIAALAEAIVAFVLNPKL